MRAPITKEPIPSQSFSLSGGHLSIVRDDQPNQPLAPAAPVADNPQPNRLARFAALLARRYTIVLSALAIAGLVGFAYLKLATPLYTTSAQIMVQPLVISSAAFNAQDRQRAMRCEENLIVSTPVLASALTLPTVHDLSMLKGHTDALKVLKQQLRVDSTNGDSLMDISFDTIDPREGTRLLGAVVDSYVRFRSGLHGALADGSAARIQLERQAVVQTLHDKQRALSEFGVQHGLAQGNEEVEASAATLHELSLKLAQAHVATIAAQAVYDQVQQDLASDPRLRDRLSQSRDLDSSLAEGDEQAIAQQIVALQTQLAGYGNKFMAGYAPVQLLHRKIDDLKFERDAIIQQRWQSAVRTESELKAAYAQEESIAALSESARQSFEQHKADVVQAQKQVADFDAQLHELDAAAKAISTMVTVIEPATASDHPTTPRTGWVMLIALASGLLVGCVVAGIYDAAHPSLAADLKTGRLKPLVEGLPTLARLPAVSRRQLSMNSWRDRMVDSAAEFAEACQHVCDAIEAVSSFAGGRTVLITSTTPREGKSTLASLLALTVAQTSKRVLLVDANLHTPSQAGIFGIEGDFGLGQLLETEAESSFLEHVHPGIDARMDVLLAGGTQDCIQDLLNGQRFTNLLAEMAAEYDYVLIDAPALSIGTDARIIASSCDATLVLCGESNLNRKTLAKARDGLSSVGAHVIGLVINAGMEAVGQADALPTPARPIMSLHNDATDVENNLDDSAPAPAPISVKVTTLEPEPTADEAVAPAAPEVDPAQAVFTAYVRRAAEHVAPEPVAAADSAISQWVWSYVLAGILLLGGWMSFSSLFAVATVRGPVISTQPESVALWIAAAGLVLVFGIAGAQVRPPVADIALAALAAIVASVSFHGGLLNTIASAIQPSAVAASGVESILLFATLLMGWMIARRITRPEGSLVLQENWLSDSALAIFAQASVNAALLILLSGWHSKGECLAVIAFTSCLAAMPAHWLAPRTSSICFWISPMVVALFGYLCGAMAGHGMHLGMLTALARPLPLDYAGMGPLGAMLGFWLAQSAGKFIVPLLDPAR